MQKYIGENSDKVKGAILFASATAGGMRFLQTIKDGVKHKDLRKATLAAFGCIKIMTANAVYESAFFDKRISKEKAELYKEKLHRNIIPYNLSLKIFAMI